MCYYRRICICELILFFFLIMMLVVLCVCVCVYKMMVWDAMLYVVVVLYRKKKKIQIRRNCMHNDVCVYVCGVLI